MSATAAITANYKSSEDVLSATPAGALASAFDSTTGVLAITGIDTLENYQATLRSVKYVNMSDNPSTDARTVTFVVNDGALASVGRSRSIAVAAVNDSPTLFEMEGTDLSYTENSVATPLSLSVAVADPDSLNATGALVRILVSYYPLEDLLSFVNAYGITGAFDAGAGTLTLTGTTTLANYQAALRTVGYSNASDKPHLDPRTVVFTITDGSATSAAQVRTVGLPRLTTRLCSMPSSSVLSALRRMMRPPRYGQSHRR